MSVQGVAEGLPRIGVVGLHRGGSEAEDQRSMARIIEVIDGSKRARAVDAEALAEALGGRRELARTEGLLAPGRRLLAEGRNLYQQARPEAAVPTLERAIAAFRAGVAGTNSTRELWEAWVYLGTSLLALDRTEPGRFALREAVALDPERSPDPALFPPQVIAAWEAVRREARSQVVSLQIHAPPEATVYLDGQAVGAGSRTVMVLPGEHFLVAWAADGHAFQRLRIPPGQPASAALEPGPPVLGVAASNAEDRSAQIAALYRAVGAHARQVDLLLLAGLDDGGMSVQLYSPEADAFSRPVQREELDDEALSWSISGLLGVVEADGSLLATAPEAIALDLASNPTLSRMLLAGSPPEEAPAPERRAGIRPRAVLGGIAAAVLVGAGTGLAIHLSGSGPTHGGTIRVGPF